MALLFWAVSCGSPPSDDSTLRTKLIYGRDDRVELFQADEVAQTLGASVVGLGRRSEVVENAPGSLTVLSPTWKERAGLCKNEPFSEQPSFALCTGVAIGSDLVLTAAYCARAAPLDELTVVSGYAYQAQGELELASNGRLHAIEAVLASDSYWDYAWLRVEDGLTALTPEHRAPADVVAGDAVFSINHGGGLPAKVDAGGTAYPIDDREFLTTLDVFGGASGGPVFSSDANLLGIVTAGGEDYAPASPDCVSVATSPDLAEAANERSIRLDLPIKAICDAAPGDAAIKASCQDLVDQREAPEPGGCGTAPLRSGWARSTWGYFVLCLVCARSARRCGLGRFGRLAT